MKLLDPCLINQFCTRNHWDEIRKSYRDMFSLPHYARLDYNDLTIVYP